MITDTTENQVPLAKGRWAQRKDSTFNLHLSAAVKCVFLAGGFKDSRV